MKKLMKFLKISSLFSLIVFVTIFISCEIGLGTAVDTEPPSISIISPEPASIIRDKFRIGGTWSDDGRIKEITAELKRTDKLGTAQEFTCTVEYAEGKGENTWYCIIDPLDELDRTKKTIVDGSYIATVKITDNAGRSTVQTREFKIDNTPPIIVLQRPSSTNITEESEVDSYGKTFTLTGQSAEDNNIDSLKVHIFSDPECTIPLHTVELKNVPPTIDNDVAIFGTDDYTAIYGSATKNGTNNKLYCQIEAYDGAKKYSTTVDNEILEDYGNITTSYYRYNDIATSVIATYGVTVNQLYQMNSGYYGLSNSRSAETPEGSKTNPNVIIKEISDLLTLSENSIGRFSLNPENSPSFTVSGFETIEKYNEALGDNNPDSLSRENCKNKHINGQKLIFEVARGLDNIPLNDDIWFYLIECDEKGKVLPSAVKLFPDALRTYSGNYKFEAPISKSIVVYTESPYGKTDQEKEQIKAATNLEVGHTYLIKISGTDASGNKALANGDPTLEYGFRITSSGAAPVFKKVEPSNSYLYVAAAEGKKAVTIIGEVETEDGKPDVVLSFTNDASKDIAAEVSKVTGNLYKFNLTVPADTLEIKDETGNRKSSQYDVKITAIAESSSYVQKNISYDVQAPNILDIEITPAPVKFEGKENVINKKIKFDGSVEDDDIISSVKYYVKQDGKEKQSGEFKKTTFKEIEIDTRDSSKFSDNKNISIIIEAIDRAGNKAEKEFTYFVNQKSDEPVFNSTSPSRFSIGVTSAEESNFIDPKNPAKKINRFSTGGEGLPLRITDDDGVDETTVRIYKAGSTTPYTEPVNDYNSFTLPTAVGTYKIEIDVKDGAGTLWKNAKVFFVKVSGSNPVFDISSSSVYVNSQDTTTPPITVVLKVSDEGKGYSLQIDEEDISDTDANLTKTTEDDKIVFTYKYRPEGTSKKSAVFTIVDGEGLITSRKVDFTIDNDKPEVKILNAEAALNVIGDAYPQFKGTYTEAKKLKNVYYNFVEGSEPPTISSITDLEDWKAASINSTSGTNQEWNFHQSFTNGAGNASVLGEGEYTLYLYAADEAGNISSAATAKYVVDMSAPIVTAVAPEYVNGKTNAAGARTVHLSGTITETNGLKRFEIFRGGSLIKTFATPDAGPWTYDDTPAADGEYEYSFVATDLADQSNAALKKTVIVDTLPPVVSISNTEPASLIKETYPKFKGLFTEAIGLKNIYYKLVKGTYDTENKTYTYTAPTVNSIDNLSTWSKATKTAAVGTDKEWNFYQSFKATGVSSEGLEEGGYTLYLYAEDDAGNYTATAVSREFEVDMATPIVTVVAPEYVNGTTNAEAARTVHLSGTITETNGLKKFEIFRADTPEAPVKTFDFPVAGSWTYDDTPAADGEYEYSFVATDLADQTNGEIKKTVKIDTSAPIVDMSKLKLPSAIETQSSMFKFEGEKIASAGAGSAYNSGWDKVELAFTDAATAPENADLTGTPKVEGTFSLTVEFASLEIFKTQGTKYVWVKVTDKAGNTSGWVNTYKDSENNDKAVTFVYDTAQPTITVTSLAKYNNDTFTLSGTADDSYGVASVVISDGTNEYTSAEGVSYNSGTKKWTKTFAKADLTDGTYNFTITVTDKSGKSVKGTATTIFDKTIPSSNGISITKPAAPVVIGTRNFYNKDQVTAKIIVADGTNSSGIKSVKYNTTSPAVSDTNWVEMDARSGYYDTTISGLEDGKYTVYFLIEDNAGNKSATTNSAISHSFNIDTTAPEKITLEKASCAGTEYSTFTDAILVNGRFDLELYFTIDDSNNTEPEKSTGIASIVLEKVGSTKAPAGTTISAEPVSGTTNKYKITVPASVLKTSGNIVLKATDKAGNPGSITTDAQLNIDNNKPAVNTGAPSSYYSKTDSTYTVNGAIKLSGTASDSNLESVDVCYWNAATTAWVNVMHKTGDDAVNWTSGDIDTTNLTNGNTYIFAVIAVDKAGNSNLDTSVTDANGTTVTPHHKLEGGKVYLDYTTLADYKANAGAYSFELKIDQNTDRPKLHITNLSFADSNKNAAKSNYWHKRIEMYGTIEDDDNSIASIKAIIKDNATQIPTEGEWTAAKELYENGGWSFKFEDEHGTAINGAKYIFFRVNDGHSVFTSNATANTLGSYGPIVWGNDKSVSFDANDIIPLQIDTIDPAISTIYYRTTDPGTVTKDTVDNVSVVNSGWTDINSGLNGVYGGTGSNLWILAVASDDSGISNSQIKIGQKTVPVPTDNQTTSEILYNSNSSTEHTFVVKINTGDATEIPTGQQTVTVSTTDKAGTSNPRQFAITIDNTKPTISNFNLTRDENVYGSMAVNISGQISEHSRVYFAITRDEDTTPADADWERIDEYTNSSSAWSIKFNNEARNEATKQYSMYYSTKFLNDYVEKACNVTIDENYNTVNSVTLWMYAIDDRNNQSDYAKLTFKVIPQGDKPSVEISYPTPDSIVGGTIRMSGATNIKISAVDSVWVEIDPAYNGTFSSTWADSLQTLITAKEVNNYEIITGPTYKDGANVDKPITALPKAVKASGTSSWSITLNQFKEFNEQVNGTNRQVAVRVYAVSKTGKISDVQTVVFHVDPNSPLFGQTEPFELVQYEAGHVGDRNHITARKAYVADMWIKGQWYLIGSVEDDSGISKIYYSHDDVVSKDLVSDSNYQNWRKAFSLSGNSGYKLNIPVGSLEPSFGKLEYSIEIEDQTSPTPNTNSQTIILNYDNVSPEFSTTLKDTGNSIVQSNGTYTIEGDFKEVSNGDNTQSGFNRVAMYFTRNLDGTDYIIDPMVNPGNTDGNDNRYKLSEFKKKNELYCREISNSKLEGKTIKITVSNKVFENIRRGGLCIIDNVSYLITDISYTNNGTDKKDCTVTVDGTLTSNANATVYFALAQIIDHLSMEGGTTDVYAPSKEVGNSPVQNDDDDQMVEGVTRSGSTYNWTASINSQKIYDGPITINFVAYDKAENITTKYCEGNIANNAPRIAGVKYGTDENGDGTVSDSELLSVYHNYYTVGKPGITENGRDERKNFVQKFIAEVKLAIKGDFKVVPEIVGGNTGLGYSYVYTDKTKATKSKAYTKYSVVGHASSTNIREDDLSIDISVKDMLEASIPDDNGTTITDQTFEFTIWDETAGTIAGSTSNKATITIPVKVELKDKTKPVAIINPFHWNSKTDNSLYQNNRDKGHIELEKDLPSTFSATSGEMDKDPKVSGIITIDGVATDNVLVNEIQLKIDGYNGSEFFTIAKRGTDSAWEGLGNIASGWETEIGGDVSEQAGNTVSWKFNWDTSKVENVAANDVKVVAKTIDRGSATLESGTVKYTNPSSSDVSTTDKTKETAETCLYQMDVVPYITAIKTTNRQKSGLKNNNIRSARGKYSVIVGTETDFITVEGFNLNPSAARIVNESTKAGAIATSGVALEVGTKDTTNYKSVGLKNNGSKSGYLELFVNEVRTLNNINSNDAHGSFEVSAGGATITEYENMPNREADYYNTKNVTLTDDRYIRFFDMKQTDVQNGYYPVMIMEEDNPVFGYVDKNGGPDAAAGTAAGTGAGATTTTSGLFSTTIKSYASHAMPQRGKFNGNNGNEIYKEYLIKASTWDSMGMARDDGGRYYNVSVYNRDGAAMSMVYDRYAELENNGLGWGAGTNYSGLSGQQVSHAYQNNAITLDSVNYTDDANNPKLGTERYRYPKLISKGNSRTNAAIIFMSYYDECTKEICFRNFKVGTQTAIGLTENKYRLRQSGLDQNGYSYSQYTNMEENYVNGAGTSTFAENAGAKTWNFGRQTAVSNGSEFFSMAVNSNNYVFIIYYDKAESKLRLYKSSKAVDGSDPNNTAATKLTWTEVDVTINNSTTAGFPEYVGGYVSMDIDSNDGLHIAASDVNDSDLSYIYIPSNTGAYTSGTHITVDQFGAVGNWTQIKVKDNIPYIGYVNATENGQRDAIKIAYATSAANASKPGVDVTTRYTTGNWEYMTVPAITPPQSGDSKFQSVCLDFDTSGTPVVGYLGDYIEFGKWLSE